MLGSNRGCHALAPSTCRSHLDSPITRDAADVNHCPRPQLSQHTLVRIACAAGSRATRAARSARQAQGGAEIVLLSSEHTPQRQVPLSWHMPPTAHQRRPALRCPAHRCG